MKQNSHQMGQDSILMPAKRCQPPRKSGQNKLQSDDVEPEAVIGAGFAEPMAFEQKGE